MTFNCSMIALGRESRNMTQEQLATKIGEPQSVLSDIERGKTEISNSLIEKIGAELQYPVSFFTLQKSINRLSKFYYRKRETFPAKHIAPLEAKIDILRKVYLKLIEQVQVNYKGLPQLPVTVDNTPERIADNVRLFFNLDDSPIDRPFTLVEKLGIPVILIDVVSDKFSGLTVQTDSNIPLIIINKNLPSDHQKFTLFHELGHLIMHSPFTDDPDFYDALADKDIVEKQADTFASAFLMPAKKAWLTFQSMNYSRLTDLKLYWKCSKQSIMYRAKDLGVIDERKFKNLYIELSRNGERKNENIKITIDQPVLLKKIVGVYEQQLNYNRNSLANECGLHQQDFNDWFNLEEQPLFRIVKQ